MKVKAKGNRGDSAYRSHPSVPREVLDSTSSCLASLLYPGLSSKYHLAFQWLLPMLCVLGWKGDIERKENIVKAQLNSEEF